MSARRLFAAGASAALALAGLAVFAPPAQAAESYSISATTPGSASIGGMLYARQGVTLTIAAEGPSGTGCIRASGGGFADTMVKNLTASFTATAATGDGLRQVAVTTYPNSGCNNNGTPHLVEYTLDNTGPAVTGTVSPAPNAAGWNKANATITWSATDTGGSGVATVVPPTDTVSVEGTTNRTATATDKVGNASTGTPVTVKLDKTAPTITGSRTPAANVNGWSNTDVTVSFTGSDALSGVKTTTGPTTLTASGDNQSVSGTTVDNADNSASTTVADIRIDKVAPSLSGAPTTSPNAAGWYKGDVMIGWTATDALSGIAGSTPPNSTITGEGTALTASASVTDKAGNSTTAQSSPAVRIDRTVPLTTVTAPPVWNKNDVTLSLLPTDALSGVAKTFYTLDGGATTEGTSIPVSAEGNHTVTFWSTDVAGNVETAHSVSFGIDKSSPTIGHTQAPPANGDGWNNTNVTVTFNCSDAISGVAECTAPVTLTTEGSAKDVIGTVTDNAGNSASDPAYVSIDKTDPTITVDPLGPPNGFGWYGVPVTTTFTALDALSGVKTQDLAHTFGEGANQTVTAHATDAAGNSASVTTPGISVDVTAPSISGTLTSTPNSKGWFNGDVTVHWTCSDNLSGVVSCPADSIVTGEGAALAASASVSDKAGHTASATVANIKIDRHAPNTTAPDVPAGWVNAPVTVALLGVDTLSDVDSSYFILDGGATTKGDTVVVGTQGVHTVEYWSRDNAGNAEAHKAFAVSLDLSAPSITATPVPMPNSASWNNTDVSIVFDCADQEDLSGLATCSAPQTVTAEGAGQLVSGSASDIAGNTASTTTTVNIDKTPPTITGTPDRAPNAAGWYNDDVTVTFAGSDALSGFASVTPPVTLHEGADQSASGTAYDVAGNSAPKILTGIDVDRTPPLLSATAKSAPNGNGWYNSPVTFEWTASDALSGLLGDKPADSVISTEGAGQSVFATVSDVAGNSTPASSSPVDIDLTDPQTSITSPSEWVNNSVTVALNAFDGLSGIDHTYYSVDGGADQTGTSFTLTAEGTHSVTYHSVDKAGNVEATHSATIKIDKSAPTIEHSLTPEPNGAHWNNTDVSVTFQCADQPALSGLKSCTGDLAVTDEVSQQHVVGTATDNAGNSATDTAVVSVDKTKPTIEGHRSPTANAEGWNNSDVTVSFTADDALSGVASVTPPSVVGEGTNQSVTGTAADAADNSASTTVEHINVDKVAPDLVGAATTSPTSEGWYRDDVVIHWTASDNRSGVASTPPNSTITGEGGALYATQTVTDRAGNSTIADSERIKIDRTAPTTGADSTSDWHNSIVTVHLTPSDGLSGIATTRYTVDGGDAETGTSFSIGTQGVHTVEYWSVDKAGNVEATHTATVRIDLTEPTITSSVAPAPNSAGWNRTPVTVKFQCADDLSGIATCPVDVPLSNDGANQSLTRSASDIAGNTASRTQTVSIDQVVPTITGGPDRAPNSRGWYAADVTVTFSCGDALSGVGSCTGPQVRGEGANQIVMGTATDNAGNTKSAPVGPLDIDETAPSLTGAPTVSPNTAGWYHSDVTITWTASDAMSGLDGAPPAPTVLSSEGSNVTATMSVADKAGNTTQTTTKGFRIDMTPPQTTISGISDWSTGVDLSLAPSDNLSGVDTTWHQVDGEPAAEGTSVTIDTEGTHTLKVWSVDKAGNTEAVQDRTVKIDRTAPTIAHDQSPAANAAQWNNTDVTVTFNCSDTGAAGATSGLASCTVPQTATAEGSPVDVIGTAVDNAGNSAQDLASLKIDKTNPTISASRTPAAANSRGWNSTDVVVTFTCDDQQGLSGVLSCPAAVTLGEGQSQSASGTAKDRADNVSEAASVTGVNVDKTAPSLSGAATAGPNANGWYKGDVTLHWTASDALSGLDGPAPADSVITGEGANLGASSAISDMAGNTTSATVSGVKIDRHEPSTTDDAPSGWRNGPVIVTLKPADGLSGLVATHYTVDNGPEQDGTAVVVSTEGTHSIQYWSVDKAGNIETHRSATVQIDLTAPTINGSPTTSPNVNGWFGGPVTVHFTCGDSLSRIDLCGSDVTVSTDGANNSATGTAKDNAGNTASTTVSGIKIDTARPSVAISGITDGMTYTLGAVPAPTIAASDLLSGLAAPATGTLTGGLSSGVGSFTYTATATDRAGNTGVATVTYKVVYGYGATLFLQPVNDTAHQVGLSTSIFNAGQTIPMKFQLTNAAGQIVQTSVAPAWLTAVKGTSTNAAVNEASYSASADSGLDYRWDGTQYIYNWKTEKNMAGSYWRVGVTLDDGKTYFVNIGLR